MKRIAATSSNIAAEMARTCGDKAQVITVKMRYETEVNEFTKLNKQAHEKTAKSQLKVS